MKRTLHLSLAILNLALCPCVIRAATNYWDLDGPTPGAGGAAPAGLWDAGVTANWTADPVGTGTAITWTASDDAIFSAGNDATNAFTVTVDTTQTAGNLTVEEGTITFSDGTSLNIGGNVAGKGIINITSGLTTTISTALEGGDDTGQITKVGAGALVLNSSNPSLGGNVVVAAGTIQIANSTALGSTLSPTIVSNGATLRTSSSTAVGEPVVLNGSGVGNTGALRCTGAAPPQANGWSGGATITSDTRINMEASGTWTWTAKPIVSTNDGNDYSVTIGGNGGSFRCNVGSPFNRTFYLGGGSITKEGSCELRFETPNIANAIYFNSGHLLNRATAGFLVTTNNTPSPIYVGSGAGQFRTGTAGPSYYLGNEITLNAGANPVFNPDATFTITCGGVIGGLGGLSKGKTGTVVFTNNNTYGGNTTINAGILTLTGLGSISNSPVITVQSGATFDVSGVTAGFELLSTQTLKGGGTINGSVTASGTISPGTSLGTLTFNNDLTIAGNLVIEVNNSLSPSNDVISVAGALTNAGTGTLTVTNAGFHLTAGDVFPIFNQPVPNGDALTIVASGGIQWTNKLAVDGTIEVLSAPAPVPATDLAVTPSGSTSYILSALGGPNATYFVFASTNVALPMQSWWVIGATTSSGAGLIQFVDTQATNSERFYRFGQ